MQELHQIAQGLLSNLLRNLCSCQVSDTFAPRAPTIEPSAPGSVALELWLPERYATLDPAVEPPAWRDPSPEQVSERTRGTSTSFAAATFQWHLRSRQAPPQHQMQRLVAVARISACGGMVPQ